MKTPARSSERATASGAAPPRSYLVSAATPKNSFTSRSLLAGLSEA
jgi:hypothetical protein